MPLQFSPAETPDFGGFEVHLVTAIDSPYFERAYDLLWAQFGDKNEMETRDTLQARFQLAPQAFYELALVLDDKGEWAAVCDYSLIAGAQAGDELVVHLSLTLVNPACRKSHLASKLLHFTICRAMAVSAGAAITLLAESEYDDSIDPAKAVRLRAFEKIGLQKADPQVVHFFQPDFSAPKDLQAIYEAQPVPLQLLLIRVGREDDTAIGGRELKRLVRRLYWMYGQQFRPQDMAHPALSLASYPADDARIALVTPTTPA